MFDILNGLEYFLSFQYLVDLGDFYIAQCAEVGGQWVDNACVDTDLDRWIKGVVVDK